MQLHEKIDCLLSAGNISNSKLSKKMNIDASLISKWRRGLRQPAKNVYLEQICEAALSGLQHEYLRRDLARVSGIAEGDLAHRERAKDALLKWLHEEDENQAASSPRHALGGETFFSERQPAHRRGREIALDYMTGKIRIAGRIPCLRIFIDEPYEWMRIFMVHLDNVEAQAPELFTKFERVSLLVSGGNRSDREFLCSWEIMDHFTNHCEVTVAIMDERYLGALQHFIIIAGEAAAISSFGFGGSRSAFSLVHENQSAIRDMAKDYDALFNRSQTILKEYPNFTAREQAQSFEAMLRRDSDIVYRTYNVPPALIPPAALQHVVHRADGSGAISTGAEKTFQHDIRSFLQHNRIFSTFPLFRPEEVERGMGNFPHTEVQDVPARVFTPPDYLEVLKYTLRLYNEHENLIVKLVRPGEIEYDFLAQELNSYSISRLAPRKYTYISTHPSVVASAIIHVRRYFADAPATPRERAALASLLLETIGSFERHLARR